MTKSIPLDSRLRRANHAFICSNVLTAKVITSLTPMSALSGNTALTRSGTPKNMPSSGKPGETQFVQV